MRYGLPNEYLRRQTHNNTFTTIGCYGLTFNWGFFFCFFLISNQSFHLINFNITSKTQQKNTSKDMNSNMTITIIKPT